jgi:hypothetical protein
MMSQPRRAPGLLRDNGLLLACLGLFAIFFVGMIISGTATYNQEQQEHGSREGCVHQGGVRAGSDRQVQRVVAE